MSISDTIKDASASEKILLVRLEPVRYLNTVMTSGPTYVFSFPHPPTGGVYRNDTELTEDTTGTPSNDEWYWDAANSQLTVESSTAPSSSNIYTGRYYLTYTNGKSRAYNVTPDVVGTDIRMWEPRVSKGPSFTQSVRNINQQNLSIDSTSLSLINSDKALNQYLSDDDSFFNRPVKVWHAFNDTDNIVKVFEGLVNDVSPNEKFMTFRLRNSLTALDGPAYMTYRNSSTGVFFNNDDFTNVQPGREGQAIPAHFQRISPYILESRTVTGLTSAQQLNFDSLYSAVCVDYSDNISTSTNRDWICGRWQELANAATISSFVAVSHSGTNYTRLTVTAAQTKDHHVGEWAILGLTGPTALVDIEVYHVDRTNNYLYVTYNAEFNTARFSAFYVDTGQVDIRIKDENDVIYRLKRTVDYFITAGLLSAGVFKIALVNNFEAAHGMSTVDPNSFQIKYRMVAREYSGDNNNDHSRFIEAILNERLKLTVNAASFLQAQTDLDEQISIIIPEGGSGSVPTYKSVIQKVLSSTMGYLFINNDFEIEYGLFSAPSATLEITDDMIIAGSFSMKLEYKDIYTDIFAQNPNITAAEYTSSSTVKLSSNRASYLHGLDRTNEITHYLEDYTTRGQDLLDTISERKVTYSFKVKTKLVDAMIGDFITIKKNGLLGSDTERDVVIVTLDKFSDYTFVEATDLLNL